MQLIKSSNILNFLTAKPEFWHWDVRTSTIAEIKNGIEFQSFKLKAKEKIQICLYKNGFNVKLLYGEDLRRNLKREFKKIIPIDLHEIINYLIFLENRNAA